MEQQPDKRVQRTRERLRGAAHRQFLKSGYQGTSIEAILVEAGIASKETLYRHYANKEALFVDVLGHLTMEQPGFSERMAGLPAPNDLSSLRQALTQLAHEIVAMICQPGYLPLVRMVLTEAPRFPELGTLFFSTVTQRGLSLIQNVLQAAQERKIIADVELEVVTRTLLGGLLTSVLLDLVLAKKIELHIAFKQADAVVEVIMRALTI